jgi:hypothetical protein
LKTHAWCKEEEDELKKIQNYKTSRFLKIMNITS